MADAEITLRDVITHLQALRHDFSGRFDRLEQRMDRFENRMDRMERNLTTQIDAIDQRLDTIEIENLPRRFAALEAVVNA